MNEKNTTAKMLVYRRLAAAAGTAVAAAGMQLRAASAADQTPGLTAASAAIPAADGMASTAAGLAALSQTPAGLRRWHTSTSVLIKYFDAKGVMETSRILMVLGGLPWAETRWPLDVSKMGAGLESAAPEYTTAREAGELEANLGRGPVVIIGGKHVLSQSRAIERYLARQLGMMGEDELAAHHIDSFTECDALS